MRERERSRRFEKYSMRKMLNEIEILTIYVINCLKGNNNKIIFKTKLRMSQYVVRILKFQ